MSLVSLILFSNMVFTFTTHFCGGHLSFAVHHLDCRMPTMDVQEALNSHGLWPIPYSNIEANKDVVMIQNPGY
ncbi:RagB/SusD family nutrient uptake outer membrane protein [Arcticibacterium luteifluviistationis]|uniref:RagB/SusD family nutrient uptake outer membrane protein n=1 Tax=Arcticibacterium luteifluviistationis TaxID=1784714 RepID=UPI0013A697A5|nr:RagB/SusD family nutrient uptake outer membrane protein [Arcticibacterium luteifluviistationis]